MNNTNQTNDNLISIIKAAKSLGITTEVLNYRSEQFFKEFGLTEHEKTRLLISQSKNHPLATEYIKKYLAYIEDDNIYTPTLTAFVRTIFDISDINHLTDEDVISAIEEADAVRTKELLADFFKYVAKYENVKYHNIDLKKEKVIQNRRMNTQTISDWQRYCLTRIMIKSIV